MRVKLYLESPKGTKRNLDGKSLTAIFARISWEGKTLKYFTPENIIPLFWNTETHRARENKKFIEYPEFNERLDNIERTIKSTIRKHINDNGGEIPTEITLKNLLDDIYKRGRKIEKPTFLKFFADFIERSKNGTRKVINGNRKGKQIVPGTVKTYETTKACIEGYLTKRGKKIDFEYLDMKFYHDFVSYCTIDLNLKPNYIGKHIKTIKAVLRDAKNNFEIAVNPSFENREFITIAEEVDNIYLTQDELNELYSLDLSKNKRLDNVRDLFIIGCKTGLRFSDLSTLKPEQIKDGIITLTQIKTSFPITIPVHATVNEILKKHGGRLPKSLTNQKMNDALKDLCILSDLLKVNYAFHETKGGETKQVTLPRHMLVTCHTSRRSFCTNEFIAGTPTLVLMAISGHKTEQSFMKYIKIATSDKAMMLQGIWDERKIIADNKVSLAAILHQI